MANRTIRTPQKREAFLVALSMTASVTKAIEAASASRDAIYLWRRDDAEFAKDWDAALELGSDALEDEAVRRAHEGVDKPVYQGGKRVGTVREYSDTLLIFMLKARRPDKFKDRSATELTGKDGGAIEIADARQRNLGLIDLVSRRASGEVAT